MFDWDYMLRFIRSLLQHGPESVDFSDGNDLIQHEYLCRISNSKVVVADLEEVFLPLPDDICVPLNEQCDNLINLLDTLPGLYADSMVRII